MAAVYDPFRPDILEDPYDAYRTLRDAHPVYLNEDRDFWAVSRYEDVRALSRDWERFSNAGGVDLDGSGRLIGEGNFLEADPPPHDQLRRLTRDRFVPKAIRELEPAIRKRVVECLDRLLERGEECDIAQELALPLPFGVVCDLIGVPQAERACLEQMFQSTWAATGPSLDQHKDRDVERRAAAQGIRSYFMALAANRERSRGDDLVQDLADAVQAATLSVEQLAGICFILFVAGHETTAGLIGNSIWNLARNHDQRAALAGDRSRIPSGVEELLRFDSPIQFLMRTATTDVELHGRRIPRGARVLLVHGAANRDERRFPRADSLDVHREPTRTLTFGDGIHFCLGAPLARLEGRVVLEELLARMPDYELAGPPERWRHAVGDRGFTRLPIAYGKRSPRRRNDLADT